MPSIRKEFCYEGGDSYEVTAAPSGRLGFFVAVPGTVSLAHRVKNERRWRSYYHPMTPEDALKSSHVTRSAEDQAALRAFIDAGLDQRSPILTAERAAEIRDSLPPESAPPRVVRTLLGVFPKTGD